VRALVLLAFVGCSGLTLEDRYRLDTLACVDHASTLADSRACRAKTDVKYGVDGGAK